MVAQILAEDVGGDSRPPHEQLSEREFQVFCKLAAGRAVGDIALPSSSSATRPVSTYSGAYSRKDEFEVERRPHLLRDQEWTHSVAPPPRSRKRSDPAPAPRVLRRTRSLAERCLRVFLVEDSASLRERLGDFLSEPGKIEMSGFAATESDAVRQLSAEPVDVAIVDLNLKEGTGLGVIEAIRAQHAKAPPTIIVLTNYALSRVRSGLPRARRGLLLRQIHAIRRGQGLAAVHPARRPLNPPKSAARPG